MNVSVLIATFGEERWRDLAMSRAKPSADMQGAYEVLWTHHPDDTIAGTRNSLAHATRGDWLCFLDADDELAPGYLAAMERAWEREASARTGVLLTPAVDFVRKGRHQGASLMQKVDYRKGNYLIIGTLVSRDLFMEVGGFADEPRYGAWEDWHFWARCQMAGAKVVQVPEAVYIAHQEPDSRHRGVPQWKRAQWHYEVGRDLFPEDYPPEWLESQLRPYRRRMART